jgi:hypothetical protein
VIFGPKDSWQALHDEWFAIEREISGVPDRQEAECPIMVRVRELGVETVADGLAGIIERGEHDHLYWIGRNGLHLLDPNGRFAVLNALADEPPSACIVYMRREDLTDEERELLWEAFAPRMPVMRRKLEAARHA